MTTSTALHKQEPLILRVREQAILEALAKQAQDYDGRRVAETSYDQLARNTGLPYRDAVCGLLSLWLRKIVRGSLPRVTRETVRLELRVHDHDHTAVENLPDSSTPNQRVTPAPLLSTAAEPIPNNVMREGDYRGRESSTQNDVPHKNINITFPKCEKGERQRKGGEEGAGEGAGGRKKGGEIPQRPWSDLDRLAFQLGELLNDARNISLHRRLLQEHSADEVLTALLAALSMPADKLRKCRAALFVYLLKHSCKHSDKHSYSSHSNPYP